MNAPCSIRRLTPPVRPMRHAVHIGRAVAALLIGAGWCAASLAHDYRAGDIHIVHPYATPSVAGTSNAAAYIATLENTGTRADRLLRISTPLAGRVELHHMNVDAEGVMRMRKVDDAVLEPATPIKMRPGQGWHFMMTELKQPLIEGQTFPLTMEFERGGRVDVKVVIQVPKARAAEPAAHKH
jgi:periplasmic copper chaperone A